MWTFKALRCCGEDAEVLKTRLKRWVVGTGVVCGDTVGGFPRDVLGLVTLDFPFLSFQSRDPSVPPPASRSPPGNQTMASTGTFPHSPSLDERVDAIASNHRNTRPLLYPSPAIGSAPGTAPPVFLLRFFHFVTRLSTRPFLPPHTRHTPLPIIFLRHKHHPRTKP